MVLISGEMDDEGEEVEEVFSEEDEEGRRRRRKSNTRARHVLLLKCVLCVLGVCGPVLLPLIHILLSSHLWKRYNRQVDRGTCSCSCWDTVFKGNYEVGVSAYKHVYFNATWNVFQIWLVSVVGVVCLYESLHHLCSLACRGRLHFRMAFLFATALYPHYYSWWSYFNYLNDDFYSQWYHQLYFSVTETASTLCVLRLADRRVGLQAASRSWPSSAAADSAILLLVVVLDVAVAHILISGYDQLVANVLLGDGGLHQVLRDVGFFLPDVCHVAIAVAELRRIAAAKRRPATHLVSDAAFLASVLFVLGSWILCISL